MRESLKGLAEKWFKQADYDLKDAQKAMSWGSFNLSCFLSQQAAEKALKAFLYFSGVKNTFLHKRKNPLSEGLKWI